MQRTKKELLKKILNKFRIKINKKLDIFCEIKHYRSTHPQNESVDLLS